MSLRVRILVYALFVVSGATALVYQVTWVRDLSLIFGASFQATSVVLASFMAGLALGSFVLGHRSPGLARPLRVYGLLEIGVALSALALPTVLAWLDSIYVGAALRSDGVSLGLTLTRVAMAFGALVVPTFFMGGTLPVLVRVVVRRYGDFGVGLAWLYGLNTLGAVLGALAAGFLLIPWLGVWHTQVSAVVVNLAIGGIAFLADARIPDASLQGAGGAGAVPAPDLSASHRDRPATPLHRFPFRLAFFGTAVGGMSALALEVLWTRAITLCAGSTTYSFTVMLAAFLFGIWLGSWLHAVFPLRRVHESVQFGAVMVLIGLSSFVASELIPRLPELVVRLNVDLYGDVRRVRPATTLLLAFVVMLIPCIFMGAAFPLAGQARARLKESLGQSTGDTLSLNTVGAIVGSLLAGFLLIPALGLQRGMLLAAAVNLAYGTLVLGSVLWTRAQRSRALVAAATLALMAFFLALPTLGRPWDSKVLAAFNNNQLVKYVGAGGRVDVHAALRTARIAYYREGRVSTVSVVERRDRLALLINGKAVASNTPADMENQLLLGHVPALLHPDPKTALVVGLGAGVTAGAVAAHPTIQRLSVVEIEPGVVGAARQFGDANGRVLDDPRLEIVFQDGRNYLKTTPRSFDIITADPIHPWAYGAAYLFTAEYYQLARQRLREGGIMCQWLPAYELAPADFKSVVATFSQGFRHTMLWQASGDVALVGSDSPIVIDLGELAARLRAPSVARQLASVGLDNPLSFLANLTMVGAALRSYTRDAVINTDDNLYLEFSAPRSIGAQGVGALLAVDKSRVDLLALVENASALFESAAEAEEVLGLYQWAKSSTVQAGLLYWRSTPASTRTARQRLRAVVRRLPDYGPARVALAEILVRLGAWQIAAGRFEEAVRSSREAIDLLPEKGEAHRLLGLALGRLDDPGSAIEPFETAPGDK